MTASKPSRAAVAQTPWTANADPDWAPWPGAIQITAADGTVVCWTPSGGNERAYADLIVRAINSHEDMLAALEARKFLNAYRGDDATGLAAHVEILEAAAIAKAVQS